jgi:hypothetical protein
MNEHYAPAASLLAGQRLTFWEFLARLASGLRCRRGCDVPRRATRHVCGASRFKDPIIGPKGVCTYGATRAFAVSAVAEIPSR